MTQGDTQKAERLQAQLDISRANADALQKRLTEAQEGQRAPSVTYYVTAPTLERAAQQVERQIREDSPTLPRAAREKSDRTVVTPITHRHCHGQRGKRQIGRSLRRLRRIKTVSRSHKRHRRLMSTRSTSEKTTVSRRVHPSSTERRS